MANVDVQKIRNIAVAGHGRAGKTTLVEHMLHVAGAIDRLGKIEDGTTTTDFDPEEIDRKISLSSALAHCNWKEHHINIIDTPGFINFLEDTKGSLKAVDGMVLMISAISGIKGETEKVWGYAKDFGIPCIAFVNKLDKEDSNFLNVLDDIKNTFNADTMPLQIPLGEGEDFHGMVDLLTMKAYTYKDGKPSEIDIPEESKDLADEMRNIMLERLAETDDTLLEKYLEGEELTEAEMAKGLDCVRKDTTIVPVLCGAPNTGIGVDKLLDTILTSLPSPAEIAECNVIMAMRGEEAIEIKPSKDEPFAAYVFKTVADPFAGKLSMFRVYSGTLGADGHVLNSSSETKERMGQVFLLQGKKQIPATNVGPGDIAVVAKLKNTNTGDTLCDENNPVTFAKVKFAAPLISYAIGSKNKGDEDKVSTGLHRILDEDPALDFHRDEEGQEMILAGMGQVHLEVTLEKLKRKFGVEVEMHTPKIPYRETIKKTADARHKYKKQSGGKGQFGDCSIKIEPLPRGTGYEFVNKIVGGAIPKGFIPAVDKGVQEAMKTGIYAGFKMEDVRVTLYDGSYHAVDSSEMAFKLAGSMAIKKAVEDAKPIVLEPIMNVDIITPDEYLGTVIGDINSRRGKVLGMDQVAKNQKIEAMIPMAEMLTYANQLQSMTAGRGVFSMELSTYEELPKHLTQKLVEEKNTTEEEA